MTVILRALDDEQVRAIAGSRVEGRRAMHRKLLMVAGLFVASALALPAHAQMPVKISVAGGLTLPSGDDGAGTKFSDVYDSGYNLMGSVWVKPPLWPIGLRADAMYNQFKTKSS